MSNSKKNNQSKDMSERELKEEIEKTYELRNITYQRLRVQKFLDKNFRDILFCFYGVIICM